MVSRIETFRCYLSRKPPASSPRSGQAAFVWDLAADTIAWSDNAGAVFTDIPAEALATGAAFARLIEPSRSIRDEALAQSAPSRDGEGVVYRIEYGIRAATSAPVIWIEETGCWFAGADGKPVRAQGIVRINNERHARDEQLMRLSRHDPLTGELNRTHLVAALAEAIEEAARFRSSCAFMLIGIDHLARVNDAFGFDVADAVIAEVGKRIRARLRGGDVLGRFSGNKFGLILRNCTVDDTNIAAERFLAGIRDEVVPTKSGPVSVTASIGAISIPRYARNADEAVTRAQETLDAAKRRRAGSFSLWRPNVERDAQRRVNIRVTDEIVTALNERRIVDGVRAGGRGALAAAGVLRMPGADGAGRRAGAAGARYRPGRRAAGPDPAGRSPRARTRGGRTCGLAERAAQPQHLARHHHGSGLVDRESNR